MHPKDRLQEDLKAAMKAGDTARRDALRMLTSAIKQEEVDGQKTLTEEQVVALLMREIKKRRDTVEEAERLGRPETVAQGQFEISLIEAYLPQQMSRAELEAEAKQAIAEIGASSAKDMGNVMKVLMPRVKGRADGKLINEVVKSLLGG
ncbi:MAG: GatB/YqeY domain-containing protein [Anaerolineae bacterium]